MVKSLFLVEKAFVFWINCSAGSVPGLGGPQELVGVLTCPFLPPLAGLRSPPERDNPSVWNGLGGRDLVWQALRTQTRLS